MHEPNPPEPYEEAAWERSLEPTREPETHPPAKRPESGLALRVWDPKPVPEPRVDPDLPELPWPARSAEVIRYGLARAEHWLSPGGLLREWLRLNLWGALVLSAAAVLVVPAVTAVLKGAVTWSALGADIVANVTSAALKLPPVVLAAACLWLGYRLLRRHWPRRRPEGRQRQEGFEQYQ